jgi:excinuclease ABC subunit C
MDAQSSKKNNFVFYKQLGLVPGIEHVSQKASFQKVLGYPSPSAWPDHSEKNFLASLQNYKKNIINLKLFFQGKKKKIILNFKKDMKTFAKNHEFEKANEIKKRIFALEHINDVALIKEDKVNSLANYDKNISPAVYRIEAYDIAHMSGKNMVGVMTVVENGDVAKNEYKKFIIQSQSNANDTGALEEVLSRRFRHTEWGLPNLVVVDGSTAQVNVAKQVLNRYKFDIPIVGVVKDDKHKAKAIIGNEAIIKTHKKSILLANTESHRFAIAFHKQKRNKNFLK